MALTWNCLSEGWIRCGDFLQGHTWTDCSYVLLTEATQVRTLHKGDKPCFWGGYTDLSCIFAVWGRGWCKFCYTVFSAWGTTPNKVKMVSVKLLVIPLQNISVDISIFQV